MTLNLDEARALTDVVDTYAHTLTAPGDAVDYVRGLLNGRPDLEVGDIWQVAVALHLRTAALLHANGVRPPVTIEPTPLLGRPRRPPGTDASRRALIAALNAPDDDVTPIAAVIETDLPGDDDNAADYCAGLLTWAICAHAWPRRIRLEHIPTPDVDDTLERILRGES